jgi:hypothetical protein
MKAGSKGDLFPRTVNEFHGRGVPERMSTAGYAALIDHYDLKVPLPPRLAGISERHHRVDTNDWLLLTRPANARGYSGWTP